MKKSNQMLVNFSLLFVTVVFLSLIGEVTLRILTDGPSDSAWVGNSKKFYEYDPLLGWRNIPNTDSIRTIRSQGNNKIHYQINSRGIRGPEYSYEKAGNEYRIFLLGDSYTEGYVVEFDSLFSEIMKAKLNKNKNDIYFQTINSGTSGWSTDQELLFFQNEGKKYRPDLTILFFYQNDLAYNNQPKDFGMFYKPLFKEINGELVLTNVPVPKPDKLVINNQLSDDEISVFKKLKLWLHKKSYLYAATKERINNTYFFNDLAIKLHLKERPTRADELLPREFSAWKKEYNKSVQESWHITESMLVKLKEETDLVGSRLLVVLVPHEASVYPEMWDRIKNNYGFSDEHWNINQVSFELGAICKRNGIDLLDPTGLFRTKAEELRKETKRLYDPLNEHWNDEGNKFIGELLADYVLSNIKNKN
jgi:lysophospholipase L1-like esterase